jgi:hypothetical protein
MAHSMRGGPFLKIFTQFMSYFSVVFNQGSEAVGRARFNSPASVMRLGVDLLMLYTVPMVLEMAIREALSGGDDDDEALLEKLLKNQASYLLNTVVFAREFSGIVQGYQYTGTAGAGFFNEAQRLYAQVLQGEVDGPALRALNQVAGIVFHYPATEVERLVRAAMAAEEDTVEAFKALFGYKPKAN